MAKSKTRSAPKLTPAQVRAAQKQIIRRGTKQLVNEHRKKGTYIDPKTGSSVAAIQNAAASQPQMIKLSWSQRNSGLYRCRRSGYPHVIAGALAGLGEGLYYARQLVATIPSLTLLVVTLIGGVLASVIHLVNKEARTHERLWADLAVILAGLWLCWCTVRGLDWTMALYLLIGEFALALRWWPHHRIPYPSPDSPHEPAGETVPQAWARYISCPEGVLKNVPLSDFKKTKHTDCYTVVLPRVGKTTVDTVYGLLPTFSHALNKPLEDLIWERHPKLQYAGILQVVTASPIKKPVMFDEPRSHGGAVLLGPYADGRNEATYRVYTHNSMWSGFILGGTGAGKSRLIESIAISVRARGDTVVWFCDGQNGASSGPIAKHCSWFVRAEEFGDMLDALEGIASVRQDKLNYEMAEFDKAPGFTPSPEYPGIWVILDEAYVMMRYKEKGASVWANRLDNLARSTRKVGIGFLMASQYSGLDTFGGLESLRSSMLAGNGIAMRTDSKIAGHLVAGLELDPCKLPKIPGYGYTIATDEAVQEGSNARTAPFRSRWLLAGEEKVAMGRDDLLSTNEWMAATAEPELDIMSARAAGPVYGRRHEIAENNRTLLKARMEGRIPLPRPTAPTAPATPGLGLPTIPDPPKMNFRPQSPAAQTPPEHLPTVPNDISETEQRVFMAIAKGHTRPKEMAEWLAVTTRTVSDALKNLKGLEYIDCENAGTPSVTYFIQEDAHSR